MQNIMVNQKPHNTHTPIHIRIHVHDSRCRYKIKENILNTKLLSLRFVVLCFLSFGMSNAAGISFISLFFFYFNVVSDSFA